MQKSEMIPFCLIGAQIALRVLQVVVRFARESSVVVSFQVGP